jgi:hypothetical protein
VIGCAFYGIHDETPRRPGYRLFICGYYRQESQQSFANGPELKVASKFPGTNVGF